MEYDNENFLTIVSRSSIGLRISIKISKYLLVKTYQKFPSDTIDNFEFSLSIDNKFPFSQPKLYCKRTVCHFLIRVYISNIG